jgi:dihydrolipoamide dehydrogenase
MEREFDVVVIGAGPAGEIAAGRLSDGGKRVAIIERELVGGECSYYACMPSKALLRPAELLREVARVPGAAQAVTGSLDVPVVLARRDEVIHDGHDDGQLPWLESHGIELIRGQGRLDGARRVRVGEDLLVVKDAVVIAVGSGTLFPPIPGLAEASAWSNREATTTHEVPRRLLVLGGGTVGVELADAWSSLGSQVTIIEALERLISREEPFASEQVASALEKSGVTIRTGSRAAAVEHRDGEITVQLEGGERLSGDRLLVAIGRKPHTDDLGLESVGLQAGEYIEVDDHLRAVGVEGLYAIGDANGRSLLTHSGKYQARVAADHILGHPARATTDAAGAPRVTFTDPNVAAVGLTLQQATENGIAARAIDLDTEGSAGASFHGRGAGGTTRFVVDTDREVLVGVTFVGPDVADFLQAATIAVVGEVPLRRIAHAVAPFPTRSELWLKFVEAYESDQGLTLHV